MKHNKLLFIIGLTILMIFVLFAIAPELFSPCGLKEMSEPWLASCAAHPLGTNDLGYDILTELIHAARPTLFVALSAAGASLLLGTALGIAAGSAPGAAGSIAYGIIQIFQMLPMLPMAIVLCAFLGANTGSIIVVLSVLSWSATARTVRTRTISLSASPFVEALTLLGISKSRIMLRHLLPNLSELILSRYIMSVSRAVMLEATLSFLGMGDITTVSWGRMINIAYARGAFTRGAFNWLLPPGICIAMIITAFYAVNAYFEAKAGEVSEGASYMD